MNSKKQFDLTVNHKQSDRLVVDLGSTAVTGIHVYTVERYVYDVLGSAIAEAAADRLQEVIAWEAANGGEKITNRYSPGYCHWDVADQHSLFSLLGDSPCGITLTSSALMKPVKSISGLIGIGPKVHYRDYQCSRCRFKNCIYRK
jgi:hypothetical protein